MVGRLVGWLVLNTSELANNKNTLGFFMQAVLHYFLQAIKNPRKAGCKNQAI
jgi:hypothetical protein